MREQVLTALGRGDEAEAFRVVEPLDGTSCHVHLLPLVAATIPGATKPGMTIKEVILTATAIRRTQERGNAMNAAVSLVQIRCLMNHCAADHITFCAISS